MDVWVSGEGEPEETDGHEYSSDLAYDEANLGWRLAVIFLTLSAEVSKDRKKTEIQ